MVWQPNILVSVCSALYAHLKTRGNCTQFIDHLTGRVAVNDGKQQLGKCFQLREIAISSSCSFCCASVQHLCVMLNCKLISFFCSCLCLTIKPVINNQALNSYFSDLGTSKLKWANWVVFWNITAGTIDHWNAYVFMLVDYFHTDPSEGVFLVRDLGPPFRHISVKLWWYTCMCPFTNSH